MTTTIQPSSEIEHTLNQRANVHGKFSDNAAATQRCMDALMALPSWQYMAPVAKTSAFLIVQKLSRACSGDPHYTDHWHDIQGYAKLVEDFIKPTTTNK